MSYNIDSVDILSGVLRISDETLQELADDEDVPEANFIEYSECTKALGNGWNEIVKFWWYGEGSGRAYETLVEDILPQTKGSADLVFIWEGGDSTTGLRVKNGKVTECDVKMALVPKVKRGKKL